jgi:pyruvate dehydrogenase E2 component (dihydrolipoamide acetyltransferase)
MAIEIRIPRLGWSMEEGTLVRWLKQAGDTVASGDVLFELEGEKAVQEIEAVGSGVLYIAPDTPPPGSVVKVGAVLGYLLAPGEIPPQSMADNPVGEQTVASGRPSKSTAPPAAGPAARRRARQLGVPLHEVAGSGRSGQITRDDVEQQAISASNGAHGEPIRRRPISTPRARRVARELNIDWTRLKGTGAGGRIREIDVRSALAASGTSGDVGGTRQLAEGGTLVTPSTRRRTIAENLRRSRNATVPVTLTTTADVTALVELREQLKLTPSGVVPAYTDLIACLAARVLKQHPQLALRWNEDGATLTQPDGRTIHIGIAVDTAEGLLVPVIRDVLGKPLSTVVRESQSLIERARAGRLTAAEMQGGMFTISNLGSHGIDAFTPIIHYPQVAILGLGAIRREPVFTEGDRIEVRQRMVLSLTFDHAAIDGAPAAAFLRDLCAAIDHAAARLLSE